MDVCQPLGMGSSNSWPLPPRSHRPASTPSSCVPRSPPPPGRAVTVTHTKHSRWRGSVYTPARYEQTVRGRVARPGRGFTHTKHSTDVASKNRVSASVLAFTLKTSQAANPELVRVLLVLGDERTWRRVWNSLPETRGLHTSTILLNLSRCCK